jgi:HSP20 family protein
MQTALTRWTTPDLFRDRLDRIFNQMLTQSFNPDVLLEPQGDVTARRWMPAVDIRETADSLLLVAELPGMTREDVQITLENNVLSIAGERKFEKDVKGESYHRLERTFGTFARSFSLPANVKTDKVEAVFKDGILTVTLPKVEEAKPRRVEIK